MTHTTLDTLTDEQIRALKAEALAHNDQDTAETCARALLGYAADRVRVVEVINAAEDMDDED